MQNYFKGYLLMNPGLRGLIEWGILFASGIVGVLVTFPRLPGFPVTAFAGGALFLGGLVFHMIAERVHAEAHKNTKVISRIVDTGMYGKIRHPLYASLIICNVGIGIGFGVYWTLGLALLFSVFSMLTAVEEERFLSRGLPEYAEYMERVKWRMIPGVF
ncbi:MAG: methyltransferase family protein [Spirochaetia bacterium]